MNSKKKNAANGPALSDEQEAVKNALLARGVATIRLAPFATKPVTVRFARPQAADVKKIFRSGIAILAIALLSTIAARGDSLYPGSSTAVKTTGQAINLFSDAKAHDVGDILTIDIDESAAASSSAATQTAKSESGTLGPGVGPILQQLGTFGLSGSSAMSGSGSTSRTDSLVAEIAVTVTKVLPNGNLQVEGTRKVGMNKETETITLTGVVRQQDIASNNTVNSTLVADAQIAFGGKGPVGDKQREGLISKLFKFVF